MVRKRIFNLTLEGEKNLAGNRNISGKGSVYYRKDRKKWVAEIPIERKSNGNYRKEYHYFDTKKEATEKSDEIYYSKQNGKYLKPNKMKLSQFLDEWLANKKIEVRPKTLSGYAQVLRLYVKPYIGEFLLKEITCKEINNMNIQLKNKNYSSYTIKHANAALKASLNYAKSEKYIKTSPYEDGVKTIELEEKEVEILEDNEIKKFYQAIKGTRFESAYVLMLSSGLRPGEVLALTWDNVYIEKKEIFITEGIQRIKKYEPNKNNKSELVFGPPKTKKSVRIIYLTDRAVESLKRHKEKHDKQIEFLCKERVNRNLLFYTYSGTPIDPKNLYRDFKKILRENNITEIKLHALRHTFATVALEAGVPMKSIQAYLGHAHYSTTADIYTKHRKKLAKEGISKINNIL